MSDKLTLWDLYAALGAAGCMAGQPAQDPALAADAGRRLAGHLLRHRAQERIENSPALELADLAEAAEKVARAFGNGTRADAPARAPARR